MVEEVEEETSSEYDPVDDDLADSNDNDMAYFVSPDVINPDLNHGALQIPPGDGQPSPRPQVDAWWSTSVIGRSEKNWSCTHCRTQFNSYPSALKYIATKACQTTVGKTVNPDPSTDGAGVPRLPDNTITDVDISRTPDGVTADVPIPHNGVPKGMKTGTIV